MDVMKGITTSKSLMVRRVDEGEVKIPLNHAETAKVREIEVKIPLTHAETAKE